METYLGFLLVEVVDDDSNKKVEGEEGAKDDEADEVQVHVQVVLILWLGLHLHSLVATVTGDKSILSPVNFTLNLLVLYFYNGNNGNFLSVQLANTGNNISASTQC